jgi:hypothetical protein
MTPDQDGVEVVMCSNHPDEPAVGEDLFGTQLCDGCAVSSDRRDDEQREWDS